MKSLSIRGVAGNAKLRGKIEVVANCGCCVLTNFKNKYREHLAKKEIRNFNIRDLGSV